MEEFIEGLMTLGSEIDIKIKGERAVVIKLDDKDIHVDVINPELVGKVFKKND
ncbi:hypothetical protein ACFLQI_01065 [Candidatus Undinarchaeota archaeon]